MTRLTATIRRAAAAYAGGVGTGAADGWSGILEGEGWPWTSIACRPKVCAGERYCP